MEGYIDPKRADLIGDSALITHLKTLYIAFSLSNDSGRDLLIDVNKVL